MAGPFRLSEWGVREPPQDGANIRTIQSIAEHLRHTESARWSWSSVADRPMYGH